MQETACIRQRGIKELGHNWKQSLLSRWFGINFAATAAFLSMHCAPQSFLNIIHCVSSYRRNSCCRKLGKITNTTKKKTKTPQRPIILRVCSFLALFLCIFAWFYMIPGKYLIHGKCSRNILMLDILNIGIVMYYVYM